MKKPKNGNVEKFLFFVVCIVFLISLHKVITLTLEYHDAQKEYTQLRQYAQTIEPERHKEKTNTKTRQEETASEEAVQDTEDMQQYEAQETDTQEQALYEEQFIELDVDFEALKEINSDFCGWLYIPTVYVSYPVVQGEDNDYYLTHTFQGEENKSGAVFADINVTEPFEEANTVLHGHNMKDGSMFGKLKKLYQNKKAYAGQQYFYIYTKENSYKYLIFDAYVTSNVTQAYELSDTAPIVTLSTCYGGANEDKWLVVQGILVDKK